MGTVYLFSVDLEHTTAQYFRRAFEKLGIQHAYVTEFDRHFSPTPDDLVFAIDPIPHIPFGIENWPCSTAAYMIDVHQAIGYRLKQAQFFDTIFVAQQNAIDAFAINGAPPAHWLPLACDPNLHNQCSEVKSFDVGFVGKLGDPGSERHTVLTTVLPEFQTNDYRRFVSPSTMGQIYGQSRIVFNASIGGELNMRFFEAMASGALLITDRIPEAICGLFQEDVHYVGYTGIKEAKEKVRHYLAHETERTRIADAAQREVLGQHSYEDRWKSVLSVVACSSARASARSMNRGELAKSYSALYAELGLPGRVLDTMKHHGTNGYGLTQLLVAAGRKANRHFPMTPNAIRSRIRNRG